MLVESLSGIRGIFGDDLSEHVVRSYAAAFASKHLSRRKSAVLGYDTRPSSKQTADWIIDEWQKAGITEIYDCKVASTAAMHIAVPLFKAAGGVMITASHNEPQWNGMKFLREDGAVLLPAEADALIATSHTLKPVCGTLNQTNTLDGSRRLSQEYVLLLLRTIGDEARKKLAEMKLHILVDANGGASLPYIKDFFDRINIDVTLKGETAGHFWRTVEPNAESLTPLVEMLNIGKEDFAIAFDCDADRMEFVLPKSSAFAKLLTPLVSGQYVLGLVTEAVLHTLPKIKKPPIVVTNCATSRLVEEVALSHGAGIEDVDVGEINVVERMRELQSPVGGEGSSSGGIIPPMPGRDGLLTLAVVLRFLAETEKTLDEALIDLPRYVTMQAKVQVDPLKGEATRKKLISHFDAKKCKYVAFGLDGGIKYFPEEKQFITFRMSKTETGVYRVIADAKTEEQTQTLLELGKSLLQKLSK